MSNENGILASVFSLVGTLIAVVLVSAYIGLATDIAIQAFNFGYGIFD